MWGDIQDIFLFGCPKTIDITGFFKKFCIATRTIAIAGICIYLATRAKDTGTATSDDKQNEMQEA